MTKLENAQKAQSNHRSLTSDINRGLNRGLYANKSRYDKSQMTISSSKNGGELPWSSVFILRWGYGNYGSSDFYGCNSEYNSLIFAMAVNKLMPQIADEMVIISEKRENKAILEAKEEAQSVLNTISVLEENK